MNVIIHRFLCTSSYFLNIVREVGLKYMNISKTFDACCPNFSTKTAQICVPTSGVERLVPPTVCNYYYFTSHVICSHSLSKQGGGPESILNHTASQHTSLLAGEKHGTLAPEDRLLCPHNLSSTKMFKTIPYQSNSLPHHSQSPSFYPGTLPP